MRLRVNGEWMEWAEPMTVADLLERLGLGAALAGIAVAVNNEVVPRTRWAETVLQDGDVVEIVRAVAGGCGPDPVTSGRDGRDGESRPRPG